MITSRQLLKVMACSKAEKTVNQFCVIEEESGYDAAVRLEESILGSEGRCIAGTATAANGIYLYLYPEVEEQDELLDSLSTETGDPRFVDFVGIDACGQVVAIIGIDC